MIGSHNTTTTTPAYGATGADSTYATTAPHGTTTTTTTAPGHKGGLASKIPGTDAYKAAHGQAQHVEPGCAGQPTQVVEPGHVNTTTTGGYPATTATTAGAHHGHHSTHDTKHHHSVTQTTAVPGQPGTTVTTTTTTPKVSTGEKISGKMDVLMGKATHNPAKVAHGEILQAEGKKGLDNAAIAYAQQAGHTTRH